MTERVAYDFGTKRYIKVFWKDRPEWCPNCLGASHVVMAKTGPEPDARPFGETFLAPCPCCNKTFAYEAREAA